VARVERQLKPRVNRRRFLSAAASASALAAQPAGGDTRPRVLITSGRSRLAQDLAANLAEKYRVRLTERIPVETRFEFVQCALEQDAQTRSAVRAVDAIVHVGDPLPGESSYQEIDYLARGTYNLLSAATEEHASAKKGAPRIVFLSTLELMTPYEPDFTVSELWRPRPNLVAAVLSKHLGEYVCREFARDRKVRVIVLRLGKVVRSEEAKGFDPLWVEERDVARAVAGALDALGQESGSAIENWWRVFHIAADSPRSRFSITDARRVLGYQPQFRW